MSRDTEIGGTGWCGAMATSAKLAAEDWDLQVSTLDNEDTQRDAALHGPAHDPD